MRPPSLVLIGGPPGAGKTTLGRALAALTGTTSMTFDGVLRAIRTITTAETHPAFHQAKGQGHLDYFTYRAPETIIADATALEHATWPAIEAIARAQRTTRRTIVLDWWLLSPERAARLGDPNVRSLWLHIDAEVLEERELAIAEWREGSDDPQRMHRNFMARSRWRNDLIARQAARHGLPLIHQPGDRPVDDLALEACDLLGLVSAAE